MAGRTETLSTTISANGDTLLTLYGRKAHVILTFDWTATGAGPAGSCAYLGQSIKGGPFLALAGSPATYAGGDKSAQIDSNFYALKLTMTLLADATCAVGYKGWNEGETDVVPPGAYETDMTGTGAEGPP